MTLVPTWLQEHIQQYEPDCETPTDTSHYCDQCAAWTNRWQSLDFPGGLIRDRSDQATRFSGNYHDFTSLCGLWCTPSFFQESCKFWGVTDEIPMPVIEYSIAYASEVLFRLSGRQWNGVCERLIYPGVQQLDHLQGPNYDDYFASGCGTDCVSCGDYVSEGRRLRLPGPVNDVIEIVADGTLIPRSAYKISGRELIRVDGGCWPKYNDLSRSPYLRYPDVPVEDCTPLVDYSQDKNNNWVSETITDQGWDIQTKPTSLVDDCTPTDTETVYERIIPQSGDTSASTISTASNGCEDKQAWVIRYFQGKCPPVSAQSVTALLAKEMALTICEGHCIPPHVRRIDLQGMEMRFAPREKLFENGFTGIWQVDTWLQSVNPAKLQRRGSLRQPHNKRYTHMNLR